MKTNFHAAKNFIAFKRKQQKESLCGPGSHLENATDAINFLNKIIKERKIKSILDLGCGDWNWFSHVKLGNCVYQGWDADDDMIAENNKKYGSDKVKFHVGDIVTQKYPDVDLIICRDVLFHIKKDLAVDVVDKIKHSCKYFLSTSFRDVQENIDIKSYNSLKDWGHYPINLNIEPFNLVNYEIDFIHEKKCSEKIPRHMCLYTWDIDESK